MTAAVSCADRIPSRQALKMIASGTHCHDHHLLQLRYSKEMWKAYPVKTAQARLGRLAGKAGRIRLATETGCGKF